MVTKQTHADEQQAELITQLRTLNRRLSRQASWHQVLWRSIVAGIGSALGATIIAGLVIGFLSQTIRTIEDVPIVGNLIQSEFKW